MRALLVHPRLPRTRRGLEPAHLFGGAEATLPPLGLLTIASLLPRRWSLRLVDEGVTLLDDEDLRWADVVLVSAIREQAPAFHRVVARAHALGRRVVAGGPFVTADPEGASDADHRVIGEAEELVAGLAEALERGHAPRVLRAEGRPSLDRAPLPRFDLLPDPRAYAAAAIELARPPNRAKAPRRVLRELETLRACSFSGPVLLLDDAFGGSSTRKIVGLLETWSALRGYPFEFSARAPLGIAGDGALLGSMVRAGFSTVFLDLHAPPQSGAGEEVERIVRAGLGAVGTLLVDAGSPEILERQARFIASAPMPLAMVGMSGHRRAEAGGRLLGGAVRSCRNLLAALYEPRAYFDRALRQLELQRAAGTPHRRPSWRGTELARAILRQGLRSEHRAESWAYLRRVAREMPPMLPRAVELAVKGERLIRHTFEEVLPRLGRDDASPEPSAT